MANLRTNNLSGEGGKNAISGSVFFGGNSDALSIPASSDFAYGTGDFTIEAWIWKEGSVASGQSRGIFTQTQSGNNYVVFQIGSTNNIQATFGSTTISHNDTLAVNSWNHVAVSRSSNTVKVFLNGIASSGSTVSTDFSDTTRNPTIGNYTHSYGSLPYFGYISNLRVCKGHAVYTADFTPPSSPLSVHDIADDDKTVLLCCQDSNNPLQEATGKTITGYGRHPSQAYDVNGEGPELVTSTGVWTLSNGGSGGSNFTVSNSGRGLSGTTVPSGYIRANYGGLNAQSKYRIKVTLTAGSNNNFAFQGYDSDGNTVTGYFPSTDGTAGASLQVGPSYVFEASGIGQWQITGSAWSTTYTINDISIKQIPNDGSPKNIPPFGVDAGNTFGGAISMNSSAWMYFPTGRTEERGRGRAVSWLGGNNSDGSYTKDIDFFDIQSLGTTTKFGELTDTVGLGAAMSSSTRGVFAGGTKPAAGNQNLLEFITIATTGNAVDFGYITTLFRYGAGISNQTRGLIAGAYQGGGASGTLNTIQYINIANLGGTADFGDVVSGSGAGIQGAGSCQSSTRGIIFGGSTGPAQVNEINSITIGTLGNSVDFGDLSAARYLCQGVSSSTRGVVAGGDNSGAVNVIELITIASAGNATDFGDLPSISEYAGSSGGSNKIRGVFTGRGDYPSFDNSMQFITIATTGNASDFGDVRTSGGTPYGSSNVSDSHGGLS